MGSTGAYMKAPWQWILKEIIFEINLAFFCSAMSGSKTTTNHILLCIYKKKSAIMFKKILTLVKRSLWCLVGFEAEEGLLGPFCCWASFQVTYLTPLRPSMQGAVFGLRCNLGTLVSSINSSSSSSSSKLSWPSEFCSLIAAFGIGIFWHLKRTMTEQSLSHLCPTKGSIIKTFVIKNAKDCTHRGWCDQRLVCLVPLINFHQILMLFIKVLWPARRLKVKCAY